MFFFSMLFPIMVNNESFYKKEIALVICDYNVICNPHDNSLRENFQKTPIYHKKFKFFVLLFTVAKICGYYL